MTLGDTCIYACILGMELTEQALEEQIDNLDFIKLKTSLQKTFLRERKNKP